MSIPLDLSGAPRTVTLSRLSDEWVGPIVATLNGVIVDVDWKYLILPQDQEPVAPTDINLNPTLVGSAKGVQVASGMPKGFYKIWQRWTQDGSSPVRMPVILRIV